MTISAITFAFASAVNCQTSFSVSEGGRIAFIYVHVRMYMLYHNACTDAQQYYRLQCCTIPRSKVKEERERTKNSLITLRPILRVLTGYSLGYKDQCKPFTYSTFSVVHISSMCYVLSHSLHYRRWGRLDWTWVVQRSTRENWSHHNVLVQS